MTREKLARAIRRKCLECSGGSAEEVQYCQIPACALFPYRMGRAGLLPEKEPADLLGKGGAARPKDARRESGAENGASGKTRRGLGAERARGGEFRGNRGEDQRESDALSGERDQGGILAATDFPKGVAPKTDAASENPERAQAVLPGLSKRTKRGD